MTHAELLLLTEAATAGWHGARTQQGIYFASLVAERRQDKWERWANEAASHARLAARAAMRAINAVEEVING